MKKIYLDHSSTTYVREEVFEEMKPYFTEKFGNPSSFHSFGLEAKEALENSREKIAGIINCSSDEIVFTSGGTESCNLAVFGVARAVKKSLDKNHIITSKIEHHAILDACRHLEKEGFKVTYLDVDSDGLINMKKLENAITEKTCLISIIYANNEVGVIQDIKAISYIAKRKKVYFHTDACQAGGLLDIDVNKLGVDLMTLNSSKIYGPKGVGLLYIKNGVEIEPILFGGGQEKGLRSGTENIPCIVGFAKALGLAQKEKSAEAKRLTKLRDKMIKMIFEKIPDARLNGHPTKRLPNNINLSFEGIEGESLLLHLDNKGICCSTGSACTSRVLEPSHVLTAMGVPEEISHSSIRFTLGRKTTEKDIGYVVKVLPEIVENLRKISPFYPLNKC